MPRLSRDVALLKHFDAIPARDADGNGGGFYNGGLKSVLDLGSRVCRFHEVPIKKFYDYCAITRRAALESGLSSFWTWLTSVQRSTVYRPPREGERDVLSRERYICTRYPVIWHGNADFYLPVRECVNTFVKITSQYFRCYIQFTPIDTFALDPFTRDNNFHCISQRSRISIFINFLIGNFCKLLIKF